MLPFFIAQILEFKLSMNRIQQFLNCDEINPSLTNLENLKRDGPRSHSLPPDVAFEFRLNGCFHWGLDHSETTNSTPKELPMPPRARSRSIFAPQSELKKKEFSNSKSKEMEIDDSLTFSEGSGGNSNSQSINNLAAKVLGNEFSMQAKDKSSSNTVFKPKKVSDFTTLKNMSLQIKKGEFVCIIGDVGSGKSSVLNSIIGDLLYLESDFYHVFKGMEVNDYLSSRIRQLSQDEVSDDKTPIVFNESYGDPKGVVAYAPQIPWIQNLTIRDNITFGLPYDEIKYKNVIKKCQLASDFKNLPGGD